MISMLILAFAFQTVTAEPEREQRISEQLHYIHPYQRGVFSCNRSVSYQQGRIFDRRFGKRIAALKQKEVALLGRDPGYEIIALGQCSRNANVWSPAFARALRQFDADLAVLEARYP